MGKYYEELNVGDRFHTHGRTLTDGDLAAFNGQMWNTEPIHNDREWVRKNTEFKDRLFPGLCTLGVATGLLLQTGLLDGTGLVLLGINDVKFSAPVYPDDTLTSTIEVVSKRESRSRPESGVVTFKHTTRNHQDKVVAEYTTSLLVYKKPR